MKKILPLFFCLLPLIAMSQKKKVMVMEIRAEIDPPMKRYVDLAMKHAEETKADIVIVDMDTYGGVLTDAKEIVDRLMSFKKPVWVYINSDAASAGALISIACDSIYMAPGASIGAATVVDGAGEKAPDKYQSYMRSIMRSTAEVNKRNPKIAEGMVDEDIEIPGIKEKGRIITFSTSEALKNGFCDAEVNSIEEILTRNQITDYSLERFELSTVDKIVAFSINPFISGILILVIISGIYFEMQSPGLGFAGLAALVALIIYLIPYYLNGLAENWEILAFLIGLGLIGVEIFLIPGFGVAGISGIIITLGSLILIMVNNNNFDFEFVDSGDLMRSSAAALGGLLGGVIALFVIGANISKTRFYGRVALTSTQDSNQGFATNAGYSKLIGRKGTAQTVLRPGGKVMVDDKLYDAFTRGEYIEPGTTVEVFDFEGASLKVKSVKQS